MQQYPMIEAHGLAKSFGQVPAVAGVDLLVPEGTALCLLGPNGAGKTTVVRMLGTLLRPDAGTARVAGHDVVTAGPAVRRQIGLAGQYACVDEFLTGRANLIMIGELSRLRRRQARARAAELLGQFGLADAAGRQVRGYSGGMRRRLDLAASLVTRPRVLFLDEPTTGLDPHGRQALWDAIGSLVRDGTTLLLTTQYLEEADQLADRIAVMNGGRITAAGTPAELKASVGGTRLVLALSRGAHLAGAAAVLARHAAGPVALAGGQDRVEVPVVPRPGLVTGIVADLHAAGIAVDDITTRQPTLGDVFRAITGGDREGRAA